MAHVAFIIGKLLNPATDVHDPDAKNDTFIDHVVEKLLNPNRLIQNVQHAPIKPHLNDPGMVHAGDPNIFIGFSIHFPRNNALNHGLRAFSREQPIKLGCLWLRFGIRQKLEPAFTGSIQVGFAIRVGH